MSITVGFVSEVTELERRVALVPETAKKIIKAGWKVLMQSGAGNAAGFLDADYDGCEIVKDSNSVLSKADVIVCISAPSNETITNMKNDSVLLGMIAPFADKDRYETANKKNITVFSMELVPRTSRAQSMDALSSQASAAGYKAVLMAAVEAPKFLPMLTTAAGTIRPSQVLVIGAGVAGLQAIATAKRLGAMVMGYDVRPETVEQVKSLGAKFLDLGVEAVGEGGYARDLTDEEKQQQQNALSDYLKKVDILITTAAVPGRPAPRLITEEMTKNLRPGTVVVDLGAEGGGNVALTEKGKTVVKNGVTYVGPVNLAGTLSIHASEMYSRNVWNLLSLMNKDGGFEINWEDDILAGSNVTKDGQTVHPMVVGNNMIDGFVALYVFMLAAFVGNEIISKVPVVLHTPLMSGSNFIHGIVLVGAMVALGHADTQLEKVFGFIAVFLGAGNAAGGYVVTERMLEMFKSKKKDKKAEGEK